jgi:hypothetical protein
MTPAWEYLLIRRGTVVARQGHYRENEMSYQRIKNNNAWLRKFMKERELTRPSIAEATCVNLSTVDRWLVPPRKTSHRKMPDMARKLLIYMQQADEFRKIN